MPAPDEPNRRRRRPQSGRRAAAFAFSLTAHLALLAAFVGTADGGPSPPDPPPPIIVTMVEAPPPQLPIDIGGGGGGGAVLPEPAPEEPVPPPEPDPPPLAPKVQPVKARPPAKIPPPEAPAPIPAAPRPPAPPLTMALADATGSGAGSGFGSGAGSGTGTGTGAGDGSGNGDGSGAGAQSCDMVRRLQQRLGSDARLRAALAGSIDIAPGRALVVWNGDWVQSGGEEGRGLARVRQAIAVEVGFAPAACRAQRMRGSVVLALGGTPVALGTGAWRWSDLLFVPGVRPSGRYGP